jgi:hypothetical protein
MKSVRSMIIFDWLFKSTKMDYTSLEDIPLLTLPIFSKMLSKKQFL